MHNFLEVAMANKQNGFMGCPCTSCGNTRSYSDSKTLHTHLLYKGFMPHYNVWTKHGERGVMMEDNKEEEDGDFYPDHGFHKYDGTTISCDPLTCAATSSSPFHLRSFSLHRQWPDLDH